MFNWEEETNICSHWNINPPAHYLHTNAASFSILFFYQSHNKESVGVKITDIIFFISYLTAWTELFFRAAQHQVSQGNNTGKAFFNLKCFCNKRKPGQVPWQKAHHDVSISCGGCTTSWAVCIGPCSNYRRVPDTTAGQEHRPILHVYELFNGNERTHHYMYLLNHLKRRRGTFKCLWNGLMIPLMIINELKQKKRHHQREKTVIFM